MQKIQLIVFLLPLIIILVHLIRTWPSHPKKPRYKHPQDALGVGPVWTEEQGPPLHYMWIWKDESRIRMEFRNMPGVVVACDSRVAGELSQALKKIVDADEKVG